DRAAELAWSMGMLCPMVTRLRQLRPRTFHRWTFLGTVCRNAVTPTRRRMSLAHHANCRTFPTCVPRCFCPFLLERLAMWPRGHISNPHSPDDALSFGWPARFRYSNQQLILDCARRGWRTRRGNRNRMLFGSILTAA